MTKHKGIEVDKYPVHMERKAVEELMKTVTKLSRTAPALNNAMTTYPCGADVITCEPRSAEETNANAQEAQCQALAEVNIF